MRPFWNTFSGRFIYPPAFDFKEVAGAENYNFHVVARGVDHTFISAHPWDSLAQVWPEIPEGVAKVTVHGLNANGKVLATAGERSFYRSPAFDGYVAKPATPYLEAGQLGLKALFVADHVQYWLKNETPDPDYSYYCYPAKVVGALVRAMCSYAQFNSGSAESKQAITIAQRGADYLIKISLARGAPYEFFPPTYRIEVRNPKKAAVEAMQRKWMMTLYGCDAAMGYLDLYKLTQEQRFLDAAQRIAETYSRTQESDGTWPLLVNLETGTPEASNRLVPTSIIFLLDRLDRDFGIKKFAKTREKAWSFIESHPLKTFAWDAQFEDTKPRPAYRNLAREQACDVAALIFKNPKRQPTEVEVAKDLLRFGEDQFVVWSPVLDRDGWREVGLERNLKPDIWIPPLVLEQYTCYMPVARSSAVFIRAYLAAFEATGEADFLQKARALGNGMVAAQRSQIQNFGGGGEIPTWVVNKAPNNWLNNSYYAADALIQLGNAGKQNQL